MKVAFWDNCLGERGTTVAMYDYAYYNEKILGNISYILYNKNSSGNINSVIKKFKDIFKERVFGSNEFKDVDNYLQKNNIKTIYIEKAGGINNRISKFAKNCIHCVFNCYQKHGDVYASISPFVSGNNGRYPVVPYMVSLPDTKINIRKELNIPDNAIVFGGYGGKTIFDLKYVHDAIYETALNNKNIYFLFANFNKFCPELKNIIHLPTIINLKKKVEFINTCDAMIHARSGGETFGLAIAEFSIKNKPVITSKTGELAHIHYLKDKAIIYSNKENLKKIFKNFDKEKIKKKDWNAYKDFSPEKVIKIFKNVFLD